MPRKPLTLDADFATFLSRNNVDPNVQLQLDKSGCTSLAKFAKCSDPCNLEELFCDARPHLDEVQLSRLTVAWQQAKAIVADSLPRPTRSHILRWTRLVRVALRHAFHLKLIDVALERFGKMKRQGLTPSFLDS